MKSVMKRGRESRRAEAKRTLFSMYRSLPRCVKPIHFVGFAPRGNPRRYRPDSDSSPCPMNRIAGTGIPLTLPGAKVARTSETIIRGVDP